MLRAIADILVLQDDPFAGGDDGDDQVDVGARELDVGRGDPAELDPVVAVRILDDVVAVARLEDVQVVAAEALEDVVAEPALEGVGYALETVDGVVASGFGDFDIMLQQLEVGPVGAVAEVDLLEQVDVADERQRQQVIDQGDLVLGPLDLHRERVARPLAQIIEIGPAQVVDEGEMIVRSAEQLHRIVGVLEDVVVVAATEHIGVAALDAGQIVVAGAAIDRIIVEQAVDRVVAGRARIGQHLLDDLGEGERRAVVEDESSIRFGET